MAERFRRGGTIGLSLVAFAGLVAGCQTMPEQPQLSRETPPELTAIELTMGVVPKPPPSGDALRTTLTIPRPRPRPADLEGPPEFLAGEPLAAVTVRSITALEPILPVETPTPVDVVGLTEDATVNLLGPPIWRNWRPPSRILRYATTDCAVDIYFYLDVVTDTFQALQVRAPGAAAEADELESCLGKVRNEHRSKDLESN